MNLGFVYNIRHVKASLSDRQAMEEAEFDEPPTIQGIRKALEKLNYKVFMIEADETAYLRLKKLKSKISLVFNIAEGLHGQDREAQIPAMLEMLEIPYVGSGPLAQAVCLNKAKTKEILKYYGLPTPDFQLFKSGCEPLDRRLQFPLIVKPNYEGSSKGIFQSSVVKNKKELREKINWSIKEFKQPAIVEELLSGREFTMALIGSSPTEVLPPVEIDYSVLPAGYIPIDSYETKWIMDNPDNKELKIVICPAKLSKQLWQKIKTICLRTAEVLDVLDWCRIDIRLDKNNVPNVLDINQLPGIIPDPEENSRFPLAARTAGYSYEQMLNKIIMSARKRYKLL